MIYGFHRDGSACHSMHCALPHTRPNEGMDTRPGGLPADQRERMEDVARMAEQTASKTGVPPELQRRLRQIGDDILKKARRSQPVNMPPVRYSPEWFAALSPEERTAVQARLSEAFANIEPQLREAIRIFRMMAPPFFKALTDAFADLARYADSLDERWMDKDDIDPMYEPDEDLPAGDGPDWTEADNIPPNAGSVT